MKKTLLSVLCITISFSSFSQTQSGGMMIGGSLSYFSSQYKGTPMGTTTSSVSPRFSYFIKDNLALGVQVSIENESWTDNATTVKFKNIGAGPTVRYYKFTSNPQFAFYLQSGFLIMSERFITASGENKGRSFTFHVVPGFSYFFTDHWGADLAIRGLTIRSDNQDSQGSAENTVITFGVESFLPSIGLYYYFGNN